MNDVKKFKVSTDCAIPPWSHLFWGHNSLIMMWFPYQYYYFYPRHYLSYLQRLESQQMYKHSCRAWRQASTRAETGTGTVGEAAAPMTAATGVPGTVVGQQLVHNTCCSSHCGCCLAHCPSPSLDPGALQACLSICHGSSQGSSHSKGLR